MEKTEKILVTGGAGYIGSHTVIELIEQGYIPVILDNFSNAHPSVIPLIETIAGQSVLTVEGDCNDQELLRALFSEHNFSGVIHFAAFKAVGESVENPLKYYQNNLFSLIQLLVVMEEFKVTKLVFSSSCTVYGTPVGATKVDEQTQLGTPGSPYGWTKLMCEQILRDAAIANPALQVIFLRYFNPIGAHPSGKIGEFPQGVPNNILPYMTQTASGVLPQLTVYGDDYSTPDGTCIRDYIHVSDLADAHIRALDYLSAPRELAVFNIGTGVGVSVLELIAAFELATGKPLNWKFGPRRPGDVVEIYADARSAAEKMNWKATRTVNDAVRDAWNWEQNRLANENRN
ncbi:MAG: UDP-glucose 4-epimerase GalE [Bacteroidota bacterium]